jgi:hypothetical protein
MHGATSFGQKLSAQSSALVTRPSRLFVHQLVDSVLDIFIELSASSDSAFASLLEVSRGFILGKTKRCPLCRSVLLTVLHLTSSSITRSRSYIMTAGSQII